MLGRNVRIKSPILLARRDPESGYRYKLNFGTCTVNTDKGTVTLQSYIIGITHPVKKFERQTYCTDKQMTHTCLCYLQIKILGL